MELIREKRLEFVIGYQDYLQGRSPKNYESCSYDKSEDRQGPFQFQMREGRCIDLWTRLFDTLTSVVR